MAMSYSYSPTKLVESFKNLKATEDDKLSTQSIDAFSSSSPMFKCTFTVACVQLTATGLADSAVQGFWQRAQDAVQNAASRDAQLILLPELFLGPYFCQSQEACLQALALPEDGNFILHKMQHLAKQHRVVLPISFFERHNNALYNSVVVIDADGSILGKYRKSHIPDGTGYQEKFYFTPGDTGFKVFTSKVYGFTIGVAICWDQWFPEAARAMALQGADILLYPTAIGSEPQDPTLTSADHWQRVMQGHAAANMVPVVASNRYGTEILLQEDGNEKQRITFYGRSFITDETGGMVAEAPVNMEEDTCIMTSTIDYEANRSTRLAWGLFRDRRPELYRILQTKDGSSPVI
jgi:N-carbamoylputrescine amidase